MKTYLRERVNIFGESRLDNNLEELCSKDVDYSLYRAIKDDNMEMVDKMAKYLKYSNDMVLNMGMRQCSVNVVNKYLPLVANPLPFVVPIVYNPNCVNIIKICIKNNIPIECEIARLLQFDDVEICQYAINKHPELTINTNVFYMYFPTEYGAEFFTPTFLTFSIVYHLFTSLVHILNTCPVYNQFDIQYSTDCANINEELPLYNKKLAKKYNFNPHDIHLLAFTKRACELYDDSDPMLEQNAKRMFNAILYVYTIRKYWYKLTNKKFTRLTGFSYNNKNLTNTFLPFLIWIARQKPKGLPKLLIYKCIYPQIF